MTDTPIYASTPPGGNQPPTPQPLNAMSSDDIERQVEALLASKMEAVEAKYQDRIAALESQLKNAAIPVTAFTAHAAGPGHNQAETWSLHLQEAARSGTLTEDMLKAAGVAESVISEVLKAA
jgi:hypothetical protein